MGVRKQAILRFNARVSPQDSITMESVLNSPPQQKSLSQKLDSFAFHSLLSSASLVNKAQFLLMPVLGLLPSLLSLKLHLDSAEYQTAIRWWLGLNTSEAPFAQSWFLIFSVIMLPLVDMVGMWSPDTIACATSLLSSVAKHTFL